MPFSQDVTGAGTAGAPCPAGAVPASSAAPAAASAAPVPAQAPALASNGLLSQLSGQPRVREFLARAVSSGRVGQAYLFLGAPGSGKLDAAWAFAQAVLCDEGGCGVCDTCRRVAHRTHPDVHCLAPESATGYLVSQIRDLLDDVALAPVRARGKVYLIESCDLLHDSAANALLKTLEEPPEHVVFVLLGTSADVILPTIVSRCQQVPFRVVPPEEAARAVMRRTGVDEASCRMAVSVAGSPERAVSFLKSAERREARRSVVRALDALPLADEADILTFAREITEAVKAPLAEVKAAQQAELEQSADYLSRGAVKQLEDRNKRELTARERSGIMEILAAARSLLRDVLMELQDPAYAPVNADVAEVVGRLAERVSVTGAACALDAVAACEQRVRKNVTPQLALEVMLFDLRKALCR